jgi:glycosyltransferase involved in cell wall biosynthesis
LTSKIKILHIISGLSTGGAERALYNVLAGGLSEVAENTVLSVRDEGTFGPRIRALNVPVFTLNVAHGILAPRAVFRLWRLLKGFCPDVIQGWMYHGNLVSSLAGWLAPVRPAIVWNVRHSLYSLQAEKFLTRQVIQINRLLSGRADGILYNSVLSREQHEDFGFSSGKVQVIPNGFNTSNLSPDEVVKRSVRSHLGLPEHCILIGHVARYHPMKDHASFLTAAVKLASQREDVFFLLVGRDVSINNPHFAEIVPKHFLARFIFLGERTDVGDLMRAIDIFSMSSAWGEAFPNVLGEAMSLGIPCVATDVGDSKLIVADTGLVVPPSDSDALARSLLVMAVKTSEERRALGQAARARIIKNFALSNTVGQYVDLYQRLHREKSNERKGSLL